MKISDLIGVTFMMIFSFGVCAVAENFIDGDFSRDDRRFSVLLGLSAGSVGAILSAIREKK